MEPRSLTAGIVAELARLGHVEIGVYDELIADIAVADIVIQPETADMEREFGAALEACFSQTPPTFIRTNDALHLASAKVAGEPEFITADTRQRAAALLMGFTVLP